MLQKNSELALSADVNSKTAIINTNQALATHIFSKWNEWARSAIYAVPKNNQLRCELTKALAVYLFDVCGSKLS